MEKVLDDYYVDLNMETLVYEMEFWTKLGSECNGQFGRVIFCKQEPIVKHIKYQENS